MEDKKVKKETKHSKVPIHEMETLKAETKEQEVRHGAMTISQLLSGRGVGGGVSLDRVFGGTSSSTPNADESRKYLVGNVLAKGGMGVVLDAKDLSCRRKVAMKMMSESQQARNDQVLRFVVEAQITAQLEHPSIVPVYELSVDTEGNVFYTMKKVKGMTLVEILEEIRNENEEIIRKFPLMRLLNIYLKICDAVAYAHSKNVVHRDLKPENIMIADFGEVLLMDWGLAKILLTDSELDTLNDDEYTGEDTEFATIDSISSDKDIAERFQTVNGQVLGTPGFMPPEQALGKVDEINKHSDVYALGGILFNILTLEPPVMGMSLKQIIRSIVRGEIEPPVNFNKDYLFQHCPNNKIPEPLSAIAMKALATKPRDRYWTVQALQDDVEKYINGFATSVEDAGIFRLLLLLVKRHRREVAIATIVSIVLCTVIIFSMIKVVEAKNEAEDNLNKFLYEKNARQEISRTLLRTALHSLQEKNPKLDNLKHRYLITDEGCSLTLEGHKGLSNIRPLENLPLVHLNLNNTGVTNLNALKGMPLKWLSLGNTEVWDLNPIKDCELAHLDISDSKVKDISPLTTTQIGSLYIGGAPIKNYGVLTKFPLTALGIDRDQLRFIDILAKLDVAHLVLRNARRRDLSLLQKMKITSLDLHGRFINSIDNLSGLPLKNLTIRSAKIKDFSILKELPLETLILSTSSIDDISFVRDLNLRELVLEKCYFLKNLAPLAEVLTIERLLIPAHVKDMEFLRKLPNIKVLANTMEDYTKEQPPVIFWRKHKSENIDSEHKDKPVRF